MSVYSSVAKTQLQEFLTDYAIGDLVRYEGIEDGVENTNYFVTTTEGEFVLTLYEELTKEQLPFFLGLMQHLSEHGVPTAEPVANRSGELVSSLCNKPAAIIKRLQGGNVMQTTVEHCRVIGKAIAQLHIAGQSYKASSCRDHNREEVLEEFGRSKVPSLLEPENSLLLRGELEHYHEVKEILLSLTRGIVHSDLFRDNCIFHTQTDTVKLSGIIDFYYACNDALIYDLAVVANDWCAEPDGSLDPERYTALLQAYHAVRPITELEKQHWHSMLRIAALRFWCFRLEFNLFPPEGELIKAKDADEFKHKIQWLLRNKQVVEKVMNSLC